MDNYLFKHEGGLITAAGIAQSLARMGAGECDVLYVHTGMQFGLPNLGLGRTRLLEALADVLYGLGVPTVIMPTYTFSFCNEEVFDRQKSPSSMGALNEHLRVKHRWLRSCDPLMSNILHGQERGFISAIGKHSVGKGCTFDLLTKSYLKVKFLFMGPRIHDCFTYMHYLEEVAGAPYRYDFEFSGLIVDGERQYRDRYTLFIRGEHVQAGGGAKIYENMLIESGLAAFERLGQGSLTLVDLEPARDLYLELLRKSPSFYIEEVFRGPVQPMKFAPRKMTAL